MSDEARLQRPRCPYNFPSHMRPIWKEYDSEFDPVVTVVGLVFSVAGAYGVVLLRHALRHPLVLIVAAIPILAGAMGVAILVREYQLWKIRQ